MTNLELKQAFMSRSAVIHKNYDRRETEYRRVSAIIYRYVRGKLTIQAECEDVDCEHSVSIVNPKQLYLKQ